MSLYCGNNSRKKISLDLKTIRPLAEKDGEKIECLNKKGRNEGKIMKEIFSENKEDRKFGQKVRTILL